VVVTNQMGQATLANGFTYVLYGTQSLGQKNPHTLTVIGGSGSGSYPWGTVVNIAANTPSAGQVFDQWTGGDVSDVNSFETVLVMPGSDMTVTANFIDVTAPSVAITAPSSNDSLSGTVLIKAEASDNVGVAKVEFYDGVSKIGEVTKAPYTFSWTTTYANGGIHSLTAKALDAAGNTGVSIPVSVGISNVGPLQPSLSVNAAAEPASLFNDFINKVNPLEQPMDISFKSTDGETGRITIYDLRGHQIRELTGANGHAVWDGRNERGELVAPDIYLVILKIGNSTAKKRVGIIH